MSHWGGAARGAPKPSRASAADQTSPASGSQKTRRWREMDSNFRFRASGDTPHRPRGEAASHRSRLPLRRDPPSGRDLDDGALSQLLEELAGEMNRPSDRKRRISGYGDPDLEAKLKSVARVQIVFEAVACHRLDDHPRAVRLWRLSHAPPRRPGRPWRPCREETVEEGGEIEAGLRIILRDADLEPRVCADPHAHWHRPKPWPTAEAMELTSAISRPLIYRYIEPCIY